MARSRIAGVAIAFLLASACGGQAVKQATTKPVAAPRIVAFQGDANGAYCRLTLDREVAQIATNMHPPTPGSPAAVKVEDDYQAFLAAGEKITPADIKPAFHTYADWYVNTLSAVTKKYNYDEERFMREASAAEKKIAQGEPANVEAAFGTVLRYESQVCGISEPASADVKFTGSKDSGYCVAYRKDQADHDAWIKSDFSTATNRAFFTGRVATIDAADRAAAGDMALPASIRKGIHAYALSYANLQLPVLTKFGFDWSRALKEGTPDERHLITNSGPDVRDQAAMDSAYNDQVCAPQ